MIEIQYQGIDGKWQTFDMVNNERSVIERAMQTTLYAKRTKVIRAIDSRGKIVDKL